MASRAELTLAAQMDIARIPYQREVTFIEGRKFRADFMVRSEWTVRNSQGAKVEIQGSHLLIEVEGGGWINGRHSRGGGMEADCEKSALAAIAGYRVMRVTPSQVNDGRALRWIIEATERKAAA